MILFMSPYIHGPENPTKGQTTEILQTPTEGRFAKANALCKMILLHNQCVEKMHFNVTTDITAHVQFFH